ncbi:MAG: hypothetical protein EOO11_19185 [Chitinophagaceae bacterium]|nr:MAG: hypothetical protein EOO11_19185 [Chitinophagaceae bacterium]
MNQCTNLPMAELACVLLCAGLFAGCLKNDLAQHRMQPPESILREVSGGHQVSGTDPTPIPNPVAQYTSDWSFSEPYSISVNYLGRPDGPYGYTQALPDYLKIPFWKGTCTKVVAGLLRTTLLKYKVGPDGGTVAQIDVPDAAAYQLSFNLMFAKDFDFGAGGKLGFGFLIGAGYSAGIPAWDGNGGSVRIMWYRTENGRVVLKPYVYYKDQPSAYGDDFGQTFPPTGSLIKGKWYSVKIYVKSNTGTNTDGRINITVSGARLLDKAIRWTTNDLERLIRYVVFETFRGGAEPYWQSVYNSNINFNNVTWTPL